MHLDLIKNEFHETQKVLEEFISKEDNLISVKTAGDLMISCFRNGGKIISCGNGGSMSDAMHFAEELSGRFREERKGFPAIAVSDPAYMSCVGNDYGYENIFARFVETFGKKGDVLFALSTSGNSKNILKAITAARKQQMYVIGLTGKDGGQMASECDVEIRAPYSKYSDRAQEIHIKVIHTLIHFIETELSEK